MQKSKEYFESGFCCAESVLLAVSENYGIKSELIPRIATGFCGGISRTSGMCGAVSGAILVLNLFYGRQSPDESRESNYDVVRQLMTLFENKFSSTNCFDLTGCRLDTDEGLKKFEENNVMKQCASYVEEAARITVEIIERFS